MHLAALMAGHEFGRMVEPAPAAHLQQRQEAATHLRDIWCTAYAALSVCAHRCTPAAQGVTCSGTCTEFNSGLTAKLGKVCSHFSVQRTDCCSRIASSGRVHQTGWQELHGVPACVFALSCPTLLRRWILLCLCGCLALCGRHLSLLRVTTMHDQPEPSSSANVPVMWAQFNLEACSFT